MKGKLVSLLILAILVVTTFLYADGILVRLSKDGKTQQPKWLEIEVTQDSADIIVVVLRMQERKLVGDYSLMLGTKSGEYKGMLIPVALTRFKRGFATTIRLPREIAAVSKLTLTEHLKDALGGNSYEINVASYVREGKDHR